MLLNGVLQQGLKIERSGCWKGVEAPHPESLQGLGSKGCANGTVMSTTNADGIVQD